MLRVFRSIPDIVTRISRQESGFVVSSEVIFLVMLLSIGLMVGLGSVRDSVISELSDSVGAIQDLNQSFQIAGGQSHSGRVEGSDFQDSIDFCDSPGDSPSQADNCIVFDVSPSDEKGLDVVSTNSSFEDGFDVGDAVRVFGGGPLHAYWLDQDDIDGWSTTAANGAIEIWDSGFLGVDAADGDYFAEINANSNAQLFQEFTVMPGSMITYSISHRGRAGVDVANVLIGPPGSQVVHQTLTTDNTGWVTYSGTYTVPAGVTTIRMGFESVSTASGNNSVGNFIDDFQISITD